MGRIASRHTPCEGPHVCITSHHTSCEGLHFYIASRHTPCEGPHVCITSRHARVHMSALPVAAMRGSTCLHRQSPHTMRRSARSHRQSPYAMRGSTCLHHQSPHWSTAYYNTSSSLSIFCHPDSTTFTY